MVLWLWPTTCHQQQLSQLTFVKASVLFGCCMDWLIIQFSRDNVRIAALIWSMLLTQQHLSQHNTLPVHQQLSTPSVPPYCWMLTSCNYTSLTHSLLGRWLLVQLRLVLTLLTPGWSWCCRLRTPECVVWSIINTYRVILIEHWLITLLLIQINCK